MKWESKVLAANQMLPCTSLFKIPPSSWIIALPAATLLLFATHLVVGFGFLFVVFYTSLVLFLSSILYYASNHKAILTVDQREDIAAPNLELENEAKEKPQEIMSLTRSPDSALDTEISLSSFEESEVDWPSLRYNIADQSIEGSDGSISDEESLIEIPLPSGHCSLQQQRDKELLAEDNDMNEEDNLMEIDISMGSIKSYSRFEIKA